MNTGRFMEYVRERGVFLDLPFDEMMRAFADTYGAARDPVAETTQDDAFTL